MTKIFSLPRFACVALMGVASTLYSPPHICELPWCNDEACDDETHRGCGCCTHGKTKEFCNICVKGIATIGTLHVTGSQTIEDDLRIGGNLRVEGNAIIIGSLTVDGVNITDAFVQNGNNFGEDAFLGTNDAFALNFETNNIARAAISSAGGLAVNEPDTATNPTLIVEGTSIVNNGSNITFSAFPTTHTYPLFTGGTQVNGSALATTVRGAPRMIWAQFNAAGLNNAALTQQSGGITAVTHVVGSGIYTLTYDAFVASPIAVVTPGTTLYSASLTGAPGVSTLTVHTYH